MSKTKARIHSSTIQAEEACPTSAIDLFDCLTQGTRDVYQNLKSYLSGFECVKNTAFVNVNSQGITNDESIDISHLTQMFSMISEQIEIGHIYQDDNTIYVPVYKSDESSQWIYCEIDPNQKDYIFNRVFQAFIKSSYELRRYKEMSSNLEVLATTDEVTGLYNQRKLSEDLEDAVIEHEANHDTFSIMFIDVDHFKDVNDNYGHVIGSKLLHDMGVLLKYILRQTDHVYRYGGDEFVVIMPNVEIKTVHSIASRVLRQLKEHTFDIENGDKYHMSISIGIAEYPTDAKSAQDIVRFADEMMYQSKKSGRGRVFHVNEVTNVDASAE